MRRSALVALWFCMVAAGSTRVTPFTLCFERFARGNCSIVPVSTEAQICCFRRRISMLRGLSTCVSAQNSSRRVQYPSLRGRYSIDRGRYSRRRERYSTVCERFSSHPGPARSHRGRSMTHRGPVNDHPGRLSGPSGQGRALGVHARRRWGRGPDEIGLAGRVEPVAARLRRWLTKSLSSAADAERSSKSCASFPTTPAMPPFTAFAEARKRIEGRRVSTRFERPPGRSW